MTKDDTNSINVWQSCFSFHVAWHLETNEMLRSSSVLFVCVLVWCCSGRLCSVEWEKKDMAMIKVGTKAKVVIGIINTHFSIYPSNEALLFILSGRFIRKTASTLRLSLFSTIHICLYYGGGLLKDGHKYGVYRTQEISLPILFAEGPFYLMSKEVQELINRK